MVFFWMLFFLYGILLEVILLVCYSSWEYSFVIILLVCYLTCKYSFRRASCFGLTCNYEESWDRPVMRWNVREKSWQLIVPLLAPQDYSQKTATTVTFRWFKNHESPVRLIKIKQSLIYLVIFRNLKCLHFLLEPFGSEGIGMKTTAFKDLSRSDWKSAQQTINYLECNVLLRENIMILNCFRDSDEVYLSILSSNSSYTS